MDLGDLGSLVLVSSIVTTITQLIKANFGTEGWKSRGVLVGLSLLGGVAYYFLANTAYWLSILQVLAFANTIYAFIIKPFEQK